MNVPVVDPAATVTEAGTVSAAKLLDTVTLAPLGAAWLRVMVQVAEEFCARLGGLQLSEETCTGAFRHRFAFAVLPL